MLRDKIRKEVEVLYWKGFDECDGLDNDADRDSEKTTDSIMKAILADLPEEEKIYAILDVKGVQYFSVSDWIKKGRNSCLDEIKKKWER